MGSYSQQSSPNPSGLCTVYQKSTVHYHPLANVLFFSLLEELYGDFEDLETGAVHKGKAGKQKDQAKEESDDEDEEEKLMKVDDETQKNKRLEKKRRLKERFDTEYDDGDATYFDDLKEEMQKQAEVRGYGVIGKRLL